jgi:hypothetical protein
MTSDELTAGILFLIKVKGDYQFNQDSPDYLGFLNCGEDITDDPGFIVVVENQKEFEPIMKQMGIGTESGIRKEETIFTLI